MNLVAKNIKWIMLASGLLTSSMLAAMFAPSWTLAFMFGNGVTGEPANIIVRNWGALVGLVGIMLIYGAFDPSIRKAALIFAIISKIVFVILIAIFGTQYLSKMAMTIAFDVLVIGLFAIFLLGEKPRNPRLDAP